MKNNVIINNINLMYLLRINIRENNIVEAKYGILSIKHKLQGSCPKICWIKYADASARILKVKIQLKIILFLFPIII